MAAKTMTLWIGLVAVTKVENENITGKLTSFGRTRLKSRQHGTFVRVSGNSIPKPSRVSSQNRVTLVCSLKKVLRDKTFLSLN